MYEAVDHQITLDPGGRNSRRLYTAARDAGEPLVKRAADRLAAALEADSTVLLSTGFPIVAANQPETDGPPGAVVLAQAVAQLGARPVFVVDAMTRPVVEAVAADLGVESYGVTTPSAAETLLDSADVAALVAVETPGQTADGSYRNMAGEEITSLVEPVDDLFVRAASQDILTVAVGDGGNEIGMESVRTAVERFVDHGKRIACRTAVEELVVAGVSNWGAYGIVAALSLQHSERLLHTPATERELLAGCVDAGAVDGVTGQPTPSVDGLSASVHEHLVGMLQGCCTTALDTDR